MWRYCIRKDTGRAISCVTDGFLVLFCSPRRFALIFPRGAVLPSGDTCRKALQAIGVNDENFAIGTTKV